MIMLTGGTGLLGGHLKVGAFRPAHSYLDITKPFEPEKDIELIIHCAAYTDVEQAETDRMNCFKTNVLGTFNLLNSYPNTPFVFISSEYAHKPTNFYAFTKQLGEELVMKHNYGLIIRTLFKPRPWKYPKAFTDQWTQGDYVDVIAPLIEQEISNWGRKTKRLVYVGTGRKTIYDLAKQSRPDVVPISVDDIKTVKLPKDYA